MTSTVCMIHLADAGDALQEAWQCQRARRPLRGAQLDQGRLGVVALGFAREDLAVEPKPKRVCRGRGEVVRALLEARVP